MKVDYPGLMKERLPSGRYRYRVRKAGQKTVKITLHVGPDHPRFREHYHAGRAGIAMAPEPDAPQVIRGSIGWLVDLYIAAMPGLNLTPGTIHQRTVFLEWLRGEVGEYSANMPASEVLKLRDKRASTPGGRKPGNVFWHFPPQPEGNEAALIEGRKGSARGGSPLDYITARVMAFFGI